METPPDLIAPAEVQPPDSPAGPVGVIVGALASLVIGFAIGSSPGIALYATVPSTIEGLGFGLAFVIGLTGVILLAVGRGCALLVCALALAVGTTVGVAVRSATPGGGTGTTSTAIVGSTNLQIPAAGIAASVSVTCNLAGSSLGFTSWPRHAVATIDQRDVALQVWIDHSAGANISLVLVGVPDASPFVPAREYTWSITSWAGSQAGLGPAIVLADMPMPTPAPVPSAPPMGASGVTLGGDLTHGQFTFTGLRAVSADQPIGTWPLVLDGRVSWSCG